jgi:DNA-binding NarL/FixJ family response regulator
MCWSWTLSPAQARIENPFAKRSATPRLKVVVIGMEADEQTLMHVLRQGALGYVLKDASAVEVVSTVRAVASGEAVCPPAMSTALFHYAARQLN